MKELLVKARQQLATPEPNSLRRACWLARSALEDTVDDLLAAKGINTNAASQRAKLSCLEGAYLKDREIAFKAEFAWHRLSEACHQHAYQLAPTSTEVEHLIDLVDELSQAAGQRPN